VKSNAVQSQAGIIGAVLGTLSGQVGLQCNPITGIGAGGANWCASYLAVICIIVLIHLFTATLNLLAATETPSVSEY
jgi:hypothetical protein